MKRRCLWVMFVAVAALAAGAADLKVALLAPLTGPASSYGPAMRDGALLAIQEWNARGGLLGKRIVPVVEDSQCAAQPAVFAANKVITQDRVRFILGEVCSSASIPVSDVANAAKVIEVTPTSTNPAVTVDPQGRTKAYIFRACFIDPFQGRAGAAFAYQNLKARTAFVLRDPGNDYVSGIAETFAAAFEALGGALAGNETYRGTDGDFTPLLEKVKAAQPDIVYLPDYCPLVNQVATQARAMGITTPFVGGDAWDSADLDTSAVAPGYFTTHYSPANPRPAVRAFIQAFGAAYKDEGGQARAPDAIAALSYDAANLLFSAIKAAGTEDTARVAAALEKSSYNGVTGRIVLNGRHDAVRPAVVMKVAPTAVAFETSVSP